MKRKDSGFAEKLLPVLISTGMVFGLVVLSGGLTDVLRTREEMNQITRAYLLEMETLGYLPNDKVIQLKEELEDCGMSSISFSGTTLNAVDYGESIQLSVSGNLDMDLHIKIPFLYDASQDWNVPINMNMVSTAKH